MSETAVDDGQAVLGEALDKIEKGGDADEEKEKRSDTREYLIFQEGNSGNWAEFSKAVASNADAAIKSADPKEGVRYAAVPIRNWSVAKAKIKIETTTSLEFE